jgi:uncharacterized protein (DUF362 family)
LTARNVAYIGRAKVAVVKTTPRTVLDDIARAMDLAEYQNFIKPEDLVHLKINISWHHYYPACSTTPWQLEGVTRKLIADGFLRSRLRYTHNQTVVVDPKPANKNNHLESVSLKYGIPFTYLYEPPIKWQVYRPQGETPALDQTFPKGTKIPNVFPDTSIIQLPTLKTHVFTEMTGAMKNAFGGLLSERRHWTHSIIHQTLVDLLTIQYEIHRGVFAVMDGSIGGEGPGPRAMRPRLVNYLLASGDQVAIDAVAAHIMGMDPLSLDFIRLAHERGLGVGDFSKIKVVGEDISKVNLKFQHREDTFASRGQKLIYHGWLHYFEKPLLRTPIVTWAYLASKLYHDWFWYPFIGKGRVRKILKTDWGELFESYKLAARGRR